MGGVCSIIWLFLSFPRRHGGPIQFGIHLSRAGVSFSPSPALSSSASSSALMIFIFCVLGLVISLVASVTLVWWWIKTTTTRRRKYVWCATASFVVYKEDHTIWLMLGRAFYDRSPNKIQGIPGQTGNISRLLSLSLARCKPQ